MRAANRYIEQEDGTVLLEVFGQDGGLRCQARLDATDAAGAARWRWFQGGIPPYLKAWDGRRQVTMQAWLMGTKPRQRIAFVNGDMYDFRRSNMQIVLPQPKPARPPRPLARNAFTVSNGVARVALHGREGLHVLVDETDWPTLGSMLWLLDGRGHVVANTREGGVNRRVRMSAMLLGEPATHIDGNRLDNRRSNLAGRDRTKLQQNVAACRRHAAEVLRLWAEDGMTLRAACVEVGQSPHWADHWMGLAASGHEEYAFLRPMIDAANLTRSTREAQRRSESVQAVADMVRRGVPFREAERQVGLGRGTCSNWRRSDPSLDRVLDAAEREGAKKAEAEVGRVYFIVAPEVRRVKIGHSVLSPEMRMGERTMVPVRDLRVLASFGGGRALEAALHRAFNAHHSHLEWFDMTPDIAAFAAEFDGRDLTASDVREWMRGRPVGLPLRLAV